MGYPTLYDSFLSKEKLRFLRMTHISDCDLADSVFSAGVVDRLSIVSRHAPDERREYQSYTHLCYTYNFHLCFVTVKGSSKSMSQLQ